jgi:hypothetical protein
MKKIKTLSESDFLKLFFGFLSVCFIVAAFFMPDRSRMLSGLLQILTQPCKVSTNYFAVGGYAATFLNMGLVGLACTLLFVALKANANNVSTLAVVLTVGFCSWGINILNMWPSVLGVVVYSFVKKEKPATLVNAMLFSTGIAPIISELMLRYPHAEVVGFNVAGIILSLVVGVAIGFFLPAGLAHAPKVHKGFDLYSAAVPVGMTAFLLQALLYKTPGVTIPAAPGAETLQVADQLIVTVFCCIVFGACIVFAFALGCKPKDYWILLKDPDQVTSFSSTYGNAVMLMNVGVYGLMILLYYTLIGASFNGVTFGIIFCMLATCNSGTHPGNVWPIMAGYVLASLGFGWVSGLVGGTFAQAINAQAIVIGVCYANGLSPIADKYGWQYGIIAAIMHYCMVTTVPSLHGGFCLYNGGFTAALVCLLLVPELERLFKTKQEKRALKAK